MPTVYALGNCHHCSWRYIILYLLLNTITSESKEAYLDALYDFEDVTELNIDDAVTSREEELNTLSDKTLSAPFIVSFEFRIDQHRESCLFSIEDDSKIIVALCFTPLGSDVTKISLKLGDNPDAIFSKIQIEKEEWKKMLFYVKEDSIALYIECNELSTIDLKEPASDIYFPSGAYIYMGRAPKRTPKSETFKKSVLNIQDGGLVIFDALLQYGYQMKGLAENNSNNKVTSP
ncbi:hypothetical protein evm_011546 [Chilo suppressalis]|nr:hypothetical protein evm_011546 [Chilo suppressalis]